ncbi:MAG: hypothetical protein ABSD85_17275 [Acidimicrobiales bacterium]
MSSGAITSAITVESSGWLSGGLLRSKARLEAWPICFDIPLTVLDVGVAGLELKLEELLSSVAGPPGRSSPGVEMGST